MRPSMGLCGSCSGAFCCDPAVPARPNGDAEHAACGADLGGRHVGQRERYEAARAARLGMVAPNGEPFYSMERMDGKRRHSLCMFEHVVHPKAFHVFDGPRPADCLCDGRRAHFVLDGTLSQVVGVSCRMRNRVAADSYRVHLVEGLLPDVEAADSEGLYILCAENAAKSQSISFTLNGRWGND